jgi:transcriptional regulator with XRE-family HTH domain
MNAIEALLKERGLRPVDLARLLGYSKSHISHLASGNKPIRRPTAIKIYRTTGMKVGPIAGLSDSDIDVLERFLVGKAA